MKKLVSVDLSRLGNDELTQLIKEHLTDIKNPSNAVTLTEGTPLYDFVNVLGEDVTAFEKQTKNVQKSEQPDPLLAADKEREVALRFFGRNLKVAELEDDPKKIEAHRLLDLLWKTHKKILSANDKSQTTGIDNFLLDASGATYTPSITFFGYDRVIERINKANNSYKSIRALRNAEEAEQFTKVFSLLNTTRKKFAELIAAHKTEDKKEKKESEAKK
ncbi:DUF6261 family protein [Limibacterium fermenti]|uniref:DUF6261 family protein n=1 Tax=Limibacterium fermenti TaxID=3229863 RepID=UPI003A65BD1E